MLAGKQGVIEVPEYVIDSVIRSQVYIPLLYALLLNFAISMVDQDIVIKFDDMMATQGMLISRRATER